MTALGVGAHLVFVDPVLSLRLGGDIGLPLQLHVPGGRDRIDELLDEVLLVAQGRAGVDGPRDLLLDLAVVAVALGGAVLLDQHEDVVDVDLDLLDELDLEHDVVVDDFSVAVTIARELIA